VELGGYRTGGSEKHMESPAFKKGLTQLEQAARARRTAFCCAERFPWRCHRRFIAQALERKGWRVIHILDRDRTWERKRELLQE
jgi:uncharacterized protein (DUF488 family)